MNLRWNTFVVLLACGQFVVLGLTCPPASMAAGQGKIVVANRGSGTISVINAKSDDVVRTVALPMGIYDQQPEPMYVVNTPASNRVWVGDRANDRVVAFDGNTFEVEGLVACEAGVFHMWADTAGQQLWVVNDIDKSVTVVDPQAMQVVATVPMPGDLIADGAKPHDVIVNPNGTSAYVTFLDTPNPTADLVVQFDTTTFGEVNRAEVGEDPHLSFNRVDDQIYLPCQGSNSVFVLAAGSLDLVEIISVPGAHGAITSTNSKRFFTTNLPNSGTDAVVSIDARFNEITGIGDTPDTVPHNLALTPNAAKLYVTHSGPNDTVSVFSIKAGGDPVFVGTVIVGTNPFGLAHVR